MRFAIESEDEFYDRCNKCQKKIFKIKSSDLYNLLSGKLII